MRFFIITIVTLFAVVQAQNSVASPYSQQLVTEGRVLLFDSNHIPPNPTYSGLIAANEKFESAVADDPGDPLANLFFAVTRVAVSYIEQGDPAGIETVRDFLESIGLTRNLEENINFPPYDDPAKIDGTYVPPSTMPTGEEFQAFLTGDFITLIDSAIGNLNVITSPTFTTTLTTAETGDIYPTEIDYGDVLLVKSLLYTAKAFIQILSAYDMDINLRETIILANADVLQIQRDLLDRYNSFLSLNPDGASRLTSAKATLMLAIDTCRLAVNFITSETDDQNDDFFSFGSAEEVAEANTALAVLTEMQNSVSDIPNRPYTETEEEWTISIVSSPQLNLYITKDYNGNFVEGSMTDNGGFYAWINDYAVEGSTISIEFGFDYGGMCPGTLSTTGILSGNQITGGTFNSADCVGTDSGTFTGTLQNSQIETPLDLNYVFGNTDKSPFDIRGILPEFDTDSDMIAGTFPQPYLNNLFPGISTELQLVSNLGLPVVYDVQFRTITLDGNNDWPDTFEVAEDDVNDAYWGPAYGNDISKLFAARDSNSFYWMMELNDPPAHNDITYTLAAFGKTNNKSLFSNVYNGTYNLYAYDEFWTQTLISSNPNDMGIGNVVEARIPLEQFDGTVKIDVEGWNGYDFFNGVILRLPNDADLSGSLSCVSCNGSGKIFIYVYDNQDPATRSLLGSAVLDSPGDYTVTGLPIGKEVYVFAHWDADNNGLQTSGDYVSKVVTSVISSSGTNKDINFNNSPVLLPGVMMLLLD